MSLVTDLKYNAPTLLTQNHEVRDFDCHVLELNNYLKKHALQNILNNSARTYVTTVENKLVGYYALSFSSVSHESASPRVHKGLGKYPIPVMLLARLAVDSTYQGKGLGHGLLKNAMLKTLQASEIAGLRAMVVHAMDESAKLFYQKHGFCPYPQDSFHLYLMMKDIKQELKKSQVG